MIKLTGAVEALAELARTTRGQNLQQLAIKAIGRVCDGHEESQRLAWDSGCVDVLIDCLRNGSCETKEVSSSALIHLSKAPEKLIKVGGAISCGQTKAVLSPEKRRDFI